MHQREGADLQRRPARQAGVAAIEFAFILPMLIALTYAMFVYSYVYVVYESINYAAQQGAEAAVAVDPASDNYEDLVRQRVQTTVTSVLSWMPASAQRDAAINNVANAVVFCGSGGGGGTYCPLEATGGTPLVVPITFPLLAPDLFPVMTLPGIGTVPPLPAALVGVGVVLLSGEI